MEESVTLSAWRYKTLSQAVFRAGAVDGVAVFIRRFLGDVFFLWYVKSPWYGEVSEFLDMVTDGIGLLKLTSVWKVPPLPHGFPWLVTWVSHFLLGFEWHTLPLHVCIIPLCILYLSSQPNFYVVPTGGFASHTVSSHCPITNLQYFFSSFDFNIYSCCHLLNRLWIICIYLCCNKGDNMNRKSSMQVWRMEHMTVPLPLPWNNHVDRNQ